MKAMKRVTAVLDCACFDIWSAIIGLEVIIKDDNQ